MFLHDFIIEDHVKLALKEDIGFADITTDCIFDENHKLKAVMKSRQEGVLCGVQFIKAVYKIINPELKVEILMQDGDKLQKGSEIAIIEGEVRGILTGERLALNYVQQLSAISTMANKYQEAIKPYNAKVVDTRKTTPLFRLFQKYATQTGGAGLHRFNLSDCVMLKDNHIEYVGSIKKAVEKVRKSLSHAHKIEIEVENMEQVKEALEARADIIMLDNMSVSEMKEAVQLIDGKAIVEASGNVNLENINEIASTGVDVISTSAIQTKAGALDIGLDYME